jgi:hypothetical protein
MLPVVKGIFKTEKSNRDFCSVKIITQVELECLPNKTYSEEPLEIDAPVTQDDVAIHY